MNVQWYPGHMEKARREMKESLKLIDLIIEILDARAPLSCSNPQLDEMCRNKERLIILNKADLSDDNENKYWAAHFEEKGKKALIINSRNRVSLKDVDKTVALICREKIERDAARGIVSRPIRAMVAGIPNSGKSTFINACTKRAGAKTGNKPGVTRGKQWIRMGKGLELLDTPGILAPRIGSEEAGCNLALIGSVNDDILDFEELSLYFINLVRKRGLKGFYERYGISEEERETGAAELLERAAYNTGTLMKGSRPDTLKMARRIIDDFRSGALGRITLDERI